MTQKPTPTDYLYAPIHKDHVTEIVRRTGSADVTPWIDHAMQTFLDRTEGDPDLWSSGYVEGLVDEEGDQFRETFGDPSRGYQWQNVFLPNGTQVRMTYKGDTTHAEIRHEKLCWGGETMSPSEFARRVAGNTSRNAWRDLYIKFPGDGRWEFADDLRRQAR